MKYRFATAPIMCAEDRESEKVLSNSSSGAIIEQHKKR